MFTIMYIVYIYKVSILLWISCAGKSLDNGPGYRESDGPVWTRMQPGGHGGREERNEGEALEGSGERDGGHSRKRQKDEEEKIVVIVIV
jgi:hypothetical protein